MADVQLEHGYTRIAHEILENMAKIKLSPTQYRIIFVIWRYTYGFNRIEHDMSLSFFSEATGCDKRSIQRDLKDLEKKNIIRQDIKNGSYRKVSFNKDYELWGKTVGETANGETTNGETANGEIANPSIGETANGTVGETANQDIYIDNFKDSNSNNNENPYTFYLQNIKRRGFTVSPFDSQLISQLENQYGLDLLMAAMKVTAKNNKDNIGYVEGILTNWEEAGVKNIEQAREYERRFRERMKKGKRKGGVIENAIGQVDNSANSQYDYGF